MGVVEELIRAREAYDRREWLAAYDGLSDAAADVLTPDDFHQLATAAYLLGRRNDCVQALQRAYQRSAAAGWPARNGCSPRLTATLSSADMCSFT